MHYQNGRNFTPESHSTTRRQVSVSVVIAYLLWLQEMHRQRPYHLVAAGRHRLLVSHEWAPDRFFIFTTVVWLFLLGCLGQSRDWICVLERVRVSHSLKSIQHYPIILILKSQWWKQQMPAGIMGHFMAETVYEDFKYSTCPPTNKDWICSCTN